MQRLFPPQIIVIIFLFWIFFGINFFISKIFSINYQSAPLFYSLYFVFATTVAIFLYRDDIKSYFRKSKNSCSFPLTMAVVIIALFFATNIFLANYFPIDPSFANQIIRKGFAFVSMSNFFLFPKLTEIAFQQVLILTITLNLLKRVKSKTQLVATFAIIFGFIHIPLIFVNGIQNIYFVIASVTSSLIFPVIITSVSGGAIYAFSIHLLFYLCSGIVFRTLINLKHFF